MLWVTPVFKLWYGKGHVAMTMRVATILITTKWVGESLVFSLCNALSTTQKRCARMLRGILPLTWVRNSLPSVSSIFSKAPQKSKKKPPFFIFI